MALKRNGNGKLKRKSGIKSKPKIIDKVTLDLDYEFYSKIWRSRAHKCEICERSLGHEMRSYMFDHLLPKERYPKLRHEEFNIKLVCGNCHANRTGGFINDKYRLAINEAMDEFNKRKSSK